MAETDMGTKIFSSMLDQALYALKNEPVFQADKASQGKARQPQYGGACGLRVVPLHPAQLGTISDAA